MAQPADFTRKEGSTPVCARLPRSHPTAAGAGARRLFLHRMLRNTVSKPPHDTSSPTHITSNRAAQHFRCMLARCFGDSDAAQHSRYLLDPLLTIQPGD